MSLMRRLLHLEGVKWPWVGKLNRSIASWVGMVKDRKNFVEMVDRLGRRDSIRLAERPASTEALYGSEVFQDLVQELEMEA